MKYSKKIVVLVIVLNALFAAADFAVFWKTGSEPTVLAASWFAFTTGELWALASIHKTKTRKKGE